MKSKLKILILLLCCSSLHWQQGHTQQLVETELRNYAGTIRSSFFSTTYVNYGSLYKDRIELWELAAGQSGYTEFSFDHFDNADILIGLKNRDNTSQQWVFHFLNGEILLNGVNYGACTSGTIYRVERCDASIKFYTDGNILSEVSLTDINFPAMAVVEVIAADLNGGNAPRLTLQFPFLNNCQSVPGTVNTGVYTDLKKQLDAGYVRLTSPVLRFKYEEEYALVAGQNESLDYLIYDWNKGLPNQTGSLQKRFGTNYMNINLVSVGTNKYYTLEVKDSKGQKYFLRFLYYCPTGTECLTFPPDRDGGGDTGLPNQKGDLIQEE